MSLVETEDTALGRAQSIEKWIGIGLIWGANADEGEDGKVSIWANHIYKNTQVWDDKTNLRKD